MTWGVAAELSPESYAESIAALDYRERGGYTRVTVPVYKSDAPDAEPFAYPTLYIGKARLGSGRVPVFVRRHFRSA